MSEQTKKEDIDQLLHDADRNVMGIGMAQMIGDRMAVLQMSREAVKLYRRALVADPEKADPAWRETGNRDRGWLARNGFPQIADIEGSR
jgi:hypothetical protein